ncbi:glycosyltransferase [Tatumella citrea]|uniref:Glycosyltransferase 2-like domain-containing protein n=1 Tax=Tatumella citrea TaxID=53336 RepID=A0A1Y0L4W9_TATCI|nr:glycosyltransferase [Tatumella citrea]ARU93086.1 hypothetical protein A7K98_04290 [Tatumella citrea]ARU97124.1 hypothetical protein A7K99_04290 [Tatumella citrea]
MKKTNVSFVILTWNREVFLKMCLPALYNAIQKKTECEIIIMDNCSDDDSYKFMQEFERDYKDFIGIKIFRNEVNSGINAYKKLFAEASGSIIIEVDDDVIEFPDEVDNIFIDYFSCFKRFGFIALDVVQNELTNGSKPGKENYIDCYYQDKIIQKGPTGGWCAGFRRKHYMMIKWFFNRYNLNFKFGEDGFIQLAFKFLGLKSGIIKDIKCLHASGPIYSRMYGLTGRDIEKYESSGMVNMAEKYK